MKGLWGGALRDAQEPIYRGIGFKKVMKMFGSTVLCWVSVLSCLPWPVSLVMTQLHHPIPLSSDTRHVCSTLPPPKRPTFAVPLPELSG